MYLGDSHIGGHTQVDFLVREFHQELDRIIGLHQYVIKRMASDFEAEYESLLAKYAGEDSSYDGGDAIWDAEKALGVNPWEAEGQVGLLSLARAISLTDIVLARLAAACWERPELTVFPKGKTWPRHWAQEFYKPA